MRRFVAVEIDGAAARPRFIATVDAIGRKPFARLHSGATPRTMIPAPRPRFLACNFWYIDALAAIGRRDEACELFTGLLERRNPFGLLSEDIHPVTGALWGNFPQTYSMAGIINSAMRLSKKWEDVWCRISS